MLNTAKKNVISSISILVIIGLGFLLLKQCSDIKDLKKEIQRPFIKPDTVYISKPYVIPEPLKFEQFPQIVTIYTEKPTVRYDNISLISTGIKLSTTKNPLDSVLISYEFFNRYVLHEKILNLNLTENYLNINILNTFGESKGYKYHIDLSQYNYQYSLEKLTYKKKSSLKLQPFFKYSYRVLNNYHDTDIGLKLKTKGINIELSLNGYYYQNIPKPLGYDLKVGVVYNF